MSKKSKFSDGIGALTVLGIVFVVLKLTGTIDWSWWWVTLPFWGGIALVIVILLFVGGIAGIVALLSMGPRIKEPKKPKESKFQKRLRELQEKQRSENN